MKYTQTRTKSVVVRLNAEEYAKLLLVAAKHGISVSGAIRGLINMAEPYQTQLRDIDYDTEIEKQYHPENFSADIPEQEGGEDDDR